MCERPPWRNDTVVFPDRTPTIALVKDPEAQGRGGLLLQYKVEDDYGVVEGRATFEPEHRAE